MATCKSCGAEIVSAGEIAPEPAPVVRGCRARTTRGDDCPAGASHPIETDAGPVGLCRRHRDVYDRRGGLKLADGGLIARSTLPSGPRDVFYADAERVIAEG
jgi:hypothetical protein